MQLKTKIKIGIVGLFFMCIIIVIILNRTYEYRETYSDNKNESFKNELFDKEILGLIDNYINKSYGVLISTKGHLIGNNYNIDKIIQLDPDLPYAYFLKFQKLESEDEYCKGLALQIKEKFPEYPETYLIWAKVDPKNGIKYLYRAFQLAHKDIELIKIFFDFILYGSFKETEQYWPNLTKQIKTLSNEHQEKITIYLLKKLYEYRFINPKRKQIINVLKSINNNYKQLLLNLPESEIYREFVGKTDEDVAELRINEQVFKVLSNFFYEEARFALALFYSSKIQEMVINFPIDDLSVFRMHRWSGFSTGLPEIFKNLAAQYNFIKIVEMGDNIELETLTPSTFTILGLAYLELSQTIGGLNKQAQNKYYTKFAKLLTNPIAKKYQAESCLLQANYHYLNNQIKDAYRFLLLWQRAKSYQSDDDQIFYRFYYRLIELFSIDESFVKDIQEIAVEMKMPMLKSLAALTKNARASIQSKNALTINDYQKDILLKFSFEIIGEQSAIDFNKHVMHYDISKENMVYNDTNAALLYYYMNELLELESYIYRIPNRLVHKTKKNSNTFLNGSIKVTKKDLINFFNIDDKNINNGVYLQKLNKKSIEASRIFDIARYFYWDKGNVDQALVLIEECLKIDDRFFDAIMLKAELEIYKGKFEKSLSSIKRAEEIGTLPSDQLNMRQWLMGFRH